MQRNEDMWHKGLRLHFSNYLTAKVKRPLKNAAVWINN